MNIIKSQKAKKLRGKGFISYQIVEDNGMAYLKMSKNDKKGTFAKTEISFVDINLVLEKYKKREIKTAYIRQKLNELGSLKNNNNAGFIMAILIDLGLVNKKDKKYFVQKLFVI